MTPTKSSARAGVSGAVRSSCPNSRAAPGFVTRLSHSAQLPFHAEGCGSAPALPRIPSSGATRTGTAPPLQPAARPRRSRSTGTGTAAFCGPGRPRLPTPGRRAPGAAPPPEEPAQARRGAAGEKHRPGAGGPQRLRRSRRRALPPPQPPRPPRRPGDAARRHGRAGSGAGSPPASQGRGPGRAGGTARFLCASRRRGRSRRPRLSEERPGGSVAPAAGRPEVRAVPPAGTQLPALLGDAPSTARTEPVPRQTAVLKGRAAAAPGSPPAGSRRAGRSAAAAKLRARPTERIVSSARSCSEIRLGEPPPLV